MLNQTCLQALDSTFTFHNPLLLLDLVSFEEAMHHLSEKKEERTFIIGAVLNEENLDRLITTIPSPIHKKRQIYFLAALSPDEVDNWIKKLICSKLFKVKGLIDLQLDYSRVR